MIFTPEAKAARKQWYEALRSGKFKQGKECWYNPGNGAYCCLGVANNILEDAVGLESGQTLGSLGTTQKIGLTIAELQLCIRMNDRYQFNFGNIADVLEEAESGVPLEEVILKMRKDVHSKQV